MAALLCVFSGHAALLSLSSQSGVIGSSLSITGFSFDPAPSNNVVHFGATRATVTASSPTTLTVLVPAGATFAPVTVTIAGLTAQSSQPFLPTYNGAPGPLSASKFAGQTLPNENGPYQTLLADLDGDGKPDLVVANAYAHSVSVYRNVSTPGAPLTNWLAAPIDLPLTFNSANDNPLGIEVADLDGDGKLDLLVCDRGSNLLLICRNLAEPGALTANSFAPPIALPTGNDPRRVRVADLDGDGRLDIVVMNYADSSLSIYQNIGTPGTLTTNSFAPRIDLPGASGPDDLVIADLDGDGQLDLAVANNNIGFVSVFQNLGAGTPLTTNSFATPLTFAAPGNGASIIAVDLDGDGLLDLVATSIQGQVMSVLRNLSTPGVLAFDAHVDFPAPGWVHNVASADLNGDGKPDLVTDGELGNFLAVFQNLSTPGGFDVNSLSSPVYLPPGYNVWGVSVGDLDGDGRPDIVFGNIYDNTLTIYRNLLPFADSPDHFDWAPIPSPQFPNAPFAVTLLAHNATNGLVTNFNRTVLLSTTNGLAVNPPLSANFNQGVWTGVISVAQPATNLVLEADDGFGVTGLANPINVVPPPALATVPVGNYLLLFWSTNSTGFGLQASPNVYPGQWTNIPTAPTQIGDQLLVPAPMTGASQFFRLRYKRP